MGFDLDDKSQTKKIIDDLKIVYEDYWKNSNKINTSIRLNINIKVENSIIIKFLISKKS